MSDGHVFFPGLTLDETEPASGSQNDAELDENAWNGWDDSKLRQWARKENHKDREAYLNRLLTVSDLENLPVVEPLVDKLLYRNTLAQLTGPPGTYKSFFALNLSCALASGLDEWEGLSIPKREKVIYVAAEGASGLRVRILAWCERDEINPKSLDHWLYIVPKPIQLGVSTQVEQITETISEVGAGLLILDTRARCTLGLEENSATEQGRAIEAAERIRKNTGCTVWVIHHSSRAGSNPRGSTAWDGAVWTDLAISKEAELAVKIEVAKHKDAPSDEVFEFSLVKHTVSIDQMPLSPREIDVVNDTPASGVEIGAGGEPYIPFVDDPRHTLAFFPSANGYSGL